MRLVTDAMQGATPVPAIPLQRNAFRRFLLLTSAACLSTAVSLFITPSSAQAQSPDESSSTDPRNTPPPDPNKPPDPFHPRPTKKKGKDPSKDPNSDSATTSAVDQPTWDPLRAEKDLEVGQFYLRKGDLDAAIDRFQDAASAKPGFAIPYRYLGEAQEKKGQKREAIKSYTRYLDLYPHAEDAAKIHKKLDKLHSEVDKKQKSSS
jgi:tetratricopeptide (TPR) repeat protein